MAAFIIDEDERLEDTLEEHEEVTELEEPVAEEAVAESPPVEDDLPEKYRGKSPAEIVRMHQEAEKALGRQSSEVGELRKLVDEYIQQQTQLTKHNAPQHEEEDVDFFDDPEKAVARAIEKHPTMQHARQVTQEYAKQTALAQLQQKHPDMNNIIQDNAFAEWVQASKIRTQLFVRADQAYDYEAADELFSLWKERQGTVAQTAAAEKQARKASAKSANTGNARGNPDSAPRKIYRRADIIKLMQTDPERYESMSDEIMRAYAEGRVK